MTAIPIPILLQIKCCIHCCINGGKHAHNCRTVIVTMGGHGVVVCADSVFCVSNNKRETETESDPTEIDRDCAFG